MFFYMSPKIHRCKFSNFQSKMQIFTRKFAQKHEFYQKINKKMHFLPENRLKNAFLC